jgi:hypothetical protein
VCQLPLTPVHPSSHEQRKQQGTLVRSRRQAHATDLEHSHFGRDRLSHRAVHLTQATSLLEILPKIQSQNPSECLAAFEAFNGEALEQRLVEIMEDMLEPCGRPRLKAIAKSQSTVPAVRDQALKALQQIPVWVYLRTSCRAGEADCKQDETACVLSKRIEGFHRPGENEGQAFSYRDPRQVGNGAPDRAEVRYFSESDGEDARALASIYTQTVDDEISVKWLPLIGRPGTIEMWMPKSGAALKAGQAVPDECAPRKNG